MNKIFITGATGNLGSRILVEFLQRDKNATFVLLVYAKDQQQGEKEVAEVLRFWGLNPEHYRHRIENILGDITKSDLGFSKEEYEKLGNSVTHVIHCAAFVRIDFDLETQRKLIVGGTKHVTALAKECQKKNQFQKFNYISSLEVSGNMEGVVKEEFLTDVKRKFFNPYEQAKAEAEEYLKKEHEENTLPISLYRPTLVVGDSETGKIVHPQTFYQILHDMIIEPEYNILPMAPARFDTIPVDFIAKIMYITYDSPDANGKIFQLAAGPNNTPLLQEALEEARSILEKLLDKKLPKTTFVPAPIFHYVLSAVRRVTFGKFKKKIEAQLLFLNLIMLNVVYDNTQTKSFIKKQGLHPPSLRDYLPVLCTYYVQHILVDKKSQ